MRAIKTKAEEAVETNDFKTEVREGFRRMELNSQELEKLARSDHDLLTKLNEQFTEGFVTTRHRVDDHEKRIRFLERVAFGLLAVIIVLQFIVGKILK